MARDQRVEGQEAEDKGETAQELIRRANPRTGAGRGKDTAKAGEKDKGKNRGKDGGGDDRALPSWAEGEPFFRLEAIAPNHPSQVLGDAPFGRNISCQLSLLMSAVGQFPSRMRQALRRPGDASASPAGGLCRPVPDACGMVVARY